MGGATRFVTLLTAPFPQLRPSLHLLRHGFSSLTIIPLRGWNLSSHSQFKSLTPRFVNAFHSQPSSNAYPLNSTAVSQQQHHHPWPEWIHLLHILSSGHASSAPIPGEIKILPDDAFVEYEELPEDFVLSASMCLAFARARPNLLGLLSRRNVEAVVVNGTPFLFKGAIECSRRMRAFLQPNGSDVPEFDGATTVDLMKYLISYASNPTAASGKNGLYSRELVDSSVRQLLQELSSVSSAPTGYPPASEHQFSGRYGQAPRPLGRNIEMKRGDWVCSKCNFMNFARNIKCLECEETRPKRQLTGGEWECPQCNFFNYGKNMVCLRCDCRRPGMTSFNPINSRPGSMYNGDYSSKINMSGKLVEFEEGQLRFGNPKDSNPVLDTSISRNMDHNYGHSTTVSKRDDMGNAAEQTTETRFSKSVLKSGSSDYQYPREKNSNSVPFVPFPANMFAKTEKTSEFEDEKELPVRTKETVSSEIRNQVDVSSEAQNTATNFQFLKNLSSQGDINSQVTEQAEKSESWLKKVVELHDANNVSSEISDEDFPEIMPLRKGENRFVVSKKKDRSLTSPKYKRQEAMDQASNTNFVPFVPFPPGYFTRKETEQPNGPDAPQKTTNDTPPGKIITEAEKSTSSKHIMDGSSTVPIADSEAGNSENSESPRKFVVNPSFTTMGNNPSTSTNASQFSGNTVVPPVSRPVQSSNAACKSYTWTDEYSGQRNVPQSSNVGAPLEVPENKIARISWTGKSLEGSAVKEPDPLDMSEEAKAERWFKRVAQIKDISELSQIPDEDFPSIMPMRKGVNRFVVSKRKTPLERRLTSQQYRRNLPIVTNDSVKNESDSS